MTDQGYDAAWGPPDPNAAFAAGYRFVSRYLSYDPSKDITASELRADRAAGLEVSLNWENYGDWQHDFSGGAATGHQHAVDAVAQAEAVGYPKGETIYFSADFDATEAQQPTINAYFQAAAEVCHAAGFRCGIYGGYYVVKRTLDALVGVDDAWQTYAWSGGQWDPRAAIQQDNNGIYVAGSQVDHDTRIGRTYLMGGTAQPTQGDIMRIVRIDDGPGRYLTDGLTYRGLISMEDLNFALSLGAVVTDTNITPVAFLGRNIDTLVEQPEAAGAAPAAAAPTKFTISLTGGLSGTATAAA